MTLQAPNLDDRRFQDLVDDAKRLVQQRCPEWTDHNVSDPGVTLIETFAWMVDQLLYRLNRVPERNYVKFLELIGVRLFPPTTARTAVTFWLSAPQEGVVRVPEGTRVGTPRSEAEQPIIFTTLDDLSILPCSRERVATQAGDGEVADQTEKLLKGVGFPCFSKKPKPDDTLLVGLSDPVPSCAVVLRFDCTIEGVGVDPMNPPLVWEVWDGDDWAECEVDRDGTGGLNRRGDLILHVPKGHVASVVAGERAGWIRCRVLEPEEGQPFYSSSPKINGLEALTTGGTVAVVNAEIVRDEILGFSEGVPGQRFSLKRGPVALGEAPIAVEVGMGENWQPWTQVRDFAETEPEDPHFVVDEITAEIVLGPAVRQPDGSLRQHGAIPPKGAALRVPEYSVGGGRRGNVARGAIRVLKSSIPLVTAVENRRPARGGVDAEEVANAIVRGPILLRTLNRAVTTGDYEELAKQGAPGVARVRAVGAEDPAGGVRVLVIPAAEEDELGRLRFEDLVPSEKTLERIAEFLDQRRVIGSRVIVEPPVYQGITVVTRVRAGPHTSPGRLQESVLEALYGYFNPIRGGPEGTGWPFGRPIAAGEVYSVLQRLPGVELVEDARLFPADPITGKRGKPVQQIELDPNALVFSYEHQAKAEEP